MKKLIFLTSLCFGLVFSAMAQDDDAYVGGGHTDHLPDYGDFAIGFDMQPILGLIGGNYYGDLGNGVQGSILFKYFLDSDKALRAKLNVNTTYEANKSPVINDYITANDPLNVLATVIDIEHESRAYVNLNFGMEFRRGSNRVQGFYGGEIVLGYDGGYKYKYDWGNPITELKQNPTSTTSFSHASISGGRTTEFNYGKGITAGLNLVLGAEYFIAPSLSIGGEFNLGFITKLTEQTEIVFERWNTSTNKVETLNTRNSNWTWTAQDMKLQTKTTGVIFMMFHF